MARARSGKIEAATPAAAPARAQRRPHIGTLRETGLHADLKRWYAQPGDVFETALDGYVIDIRRGNMLIEIQTRSFGAMRRKLAILVERHPIRIVHPVPERKWILRLDDAGRTLSRRRSPKGGRIEALFKELVSIPDLVGHPNLSFDIALTHEEELWQQTGRRAWRRKGWCVVGRRLVEVVRVVPFADGADFLALLPPGLAAPFTARDLSQEAGLPLALAYKMIYCLRRMRALDATGKRGRAALYAPRAAGK
ncbi:MAG: hypothetical protein KIT16_20230 [Rhodospirillaceae bacterium]|nr:hypothetical protein [Rhodospirillaceae bacterium]